MRLAYIELHQPPAVLAIDEQRVIDGVWIGPGWRPETIQYFEAANEVMN